MTEQHEQRVAEITQNYITLQEAIHIPRGRFHWLSLNSESCKGISQEHCCLTKSVAATPGERGRSPRLDPGLSRTLTPIVLPMRVYTFDSLLLVPVLYFT